MSLAFQTVAGEELPPDAATLFARDTEVLRADRIALGYPRAGHPDPHLVLRDFSFRLRAGETIALLGPSGVGKSSLLRTLAGLQKAQAGTVRLDGQPLDGPHPRLGFVFQDPCLLPWLTLEQNVAFGLDFKHQPRLSAEVRHERVRQAIAEVDLTHARYRYPGELSGGMAQRASLARTLARAPDILLLDEPFSALDEITRSEMQTLLLRIRERHHAAVVLVTHDIVEALLLADRVLLVGGRPGRLMGEWPLSRPYPRDEADPRLVSLHLEILQALRTARGIQAIPDTAPFSTLRLAS